MSRSLTFTLFLAVSGTACSREAIPDPRDAARAYAAAARRGDGDAVYAMMTESSRRALGRDGTRKIVLDAKDELRRQADAVDSGAAQIRTRATVRFADGERATLYVSDGRFFVEAAGALPAGAESPAGALAELRQALARRSYAALTRVLTSDARSAVETDLRSLVTGLEEPETLDVVVNGDVAEVVVPGGHRVRLRREDGIWRVEDFD